MKTIGLLVMWLAGSLVAIGVAWAGVSVVDDQIVAPAPAAELQASEFSPGPSDNATANPTTSTSATAGSEGSLATSSTSATTAGGASTATTSTVAGRSVETTTSAAVTQRPTSAVPQVTAPQATAATPPSTLAPTVTPAPTSPPAEVAITKTFALTGGTTAISFSSTGVKVLWASPNPGFDVDVEPESPGIKVEFRAEHHRSRVDAWWSGGPQHDIRERPDD